MNAEKIVVTGIGLITPLGTDRETCWDKIKSGYSLVDDAMPAEVDPELAPFARSSPFVNPNGLPKIFPMSLAAVQEALADSGVNISSIAPERIGCSVSVSKPIITDLPRFGSIDPGNPLSFQICPDSVLRFVSNRLKISGPTQNVIAACATGVHSIQIASRWLQEKKCDAALAGSVESSLHPLFVSGFHQMGVLSDQPRPFDKNRNGFVMGEGAGILILEREADASARRAKIYAELLSAAIGSDFRHPTAFAEDGSSIASVLSRAISVAEISANDIGYVNLHGTGTRLNDLIETRAVKKVFGKNAYEVPVSSTKAATGHLLGAAGSAEAAIACLALRDQFAPPTLNLENPDPECDLDYVPLKGRAKKLEIAASLSFGFGGPIGAVIFGK